MAHKRSRSEAGLSAALAEQTPVGKERRVDSQSTLKQRPVESNIVGASSPGPQDPGTPRTRRSSSSSSSSSSSQDGGSVDETSSDDDSDDEDSISSSSSSSSDDSPLPRDGLPRPTLRSLLDDSSSSSSSSSDAGDADELPGPGGPQAPTNIRQRLKSFLDRLKAENSKLDSERAAGTLAEREIDVIDADEQQNDDIIMREGSVAEQDSGQYIEMNLGLGVLEQKQSGQESISSDATPDEGLETDVLGRLMGHGHAEREVSIQELEAS